MDRMGETRILKLETNSNSTKPFKNEKKYMLTLMIQLLLSISVVLGICLSSTLFYVIQHIELFNGNHIVDLVSDVSDNLGIEIKQNVQADRLEAQEEVFLDKILAERIEMAIRKSSSKEEQYTSINMEGDTVSMQAQSFGPQPTGKAFSMRIANRVNSIEVPAGLRNVRYIRSREDLDVVASGGLELSGNLGLRVHSDSMEIGAPQGCKICSKEGSIDVIADRGLLLPSTRHIDDFKWEEESSHVVGKQREFYSLCLDRDEDEIFQTSGSC